MVLIGISNEQVLDSSSSERIDNFGTALIGNGKVVDIDVVAVWEGDIFDEDVVDDAGVGGTGELGFMGKDGATWDRAVTSGSVVVHTSKSSNTSAMVRLRLPLVIRSFSFVFSFIANKIPPFS